MFFRCDQGDHHRVMFFLNEVPVEFSECSVGLCNWDTFKRKFEYSTRCDSDLCNGSSPRTLNTNILFYSLLTSIIGFIYTFY